jgi:V8-like Glu-specific endopeptidase
MKMRTKARFFTELWIGAALISLAYTSTAGPPEGAGASKAAEYVGYSYDKNAALAKRAERHAWLLSESVERGGGVSINAEVSAQDKASIDDAPRGTSPERVGLTKSVSVVVNFQGVTPGLLKGSVVKRAHGAMKGASDGGYVYTSTLGSAGATAVRVHFTGFNLPENTSLYLYTDNGQVFGPYQGQGPLGDGEFWSHTLMGDTVHLQLRHVGKASEDDLRNTRFNVAGVGHVRPRWLGFCNGNDDCVENAVCTSAAAVNDARDAVAHMQWISGPFIYICSGGLVADTDTNSTVPYFLSANHCISRGKDARSLENFFQFSAPCGTSGNCDDVIATRNNHPQGLRTLGARIVHTASNTDHTLLELREPAPGGSMYLGWNSTPVANADGATLHRISHPGGAPQAYSQHEVDPDAPTCQSWPRGDRIYSRDTFGATEGGSSGSPVVNGAGEIVGQLSGACGTNVADQCDRTNNATVDGALAAYFEDVEQFLDPGTSCGATENNCSDGIDNDCDGLTDGYDSADCPSGGFPLGAECTSDAQCSSNKCKGRNGRKTCK